MGRRIIWQSAPTMGGKAGAWVTALLVLLIAAVSTNADASVPLKVHYEYQIPDSNDPQARELLDKALGIVADYLERSIKVKRPEDVLYLNAPCRLQIKWTSGPLGLDTSEECAEYETSQCGSAVPNESLYGSREVCTGTEPNDCRTVSGGEGTKGSQLVIYITMKDDGTCSDGSQMGEIASAVHCTKSSKDYRPTSGNINICPTLMEKVKDSEREFNHFVDTLMHETFHLLGFNPQQFEDFVDVNGIRLGEDKVVRRKGNGQVALITPNVVNQARKHFGCEEMSEVPLEDSGGIGTAGGHWPMSLFGNRETMVATIALDRSVISNLTLSLIEDSGWYTIDYSEGAVGHFDFGRGMGCTLLDNCNSESSNLYCSEGDRRTISLCTSNFYAVGSCASPLGDQCSVVQSFSNMICREPQTDDPANSLGYNPKDWGQYYGENSRCLPISKDPLSWEVGSTLSYFGIDLGGTGGCFQVGCTEDKKTIKVSMGKGREAECTEGGYIEASTLDPRIRNGKIGPCPSPESFCKTLGCPNDCSSNGDCIFGKCSCYLGFVGDTCDSKVSSTTRSSTEGTGNGIIDSNSQAEKDEEGLDATSQNPSFLAQKVSPEGGKSDLPIKAIVISSIVLVGLVVLGLTACLLSRRRSRRHSQGSRFIAMGNNGSDSSKELQTSAHSTPEPGLEESADLDGGVTGVKNMKLLYGNDIKL